MEDRFISTKYFKKLQKCKNKHEKKHYSPFSFYSERRACNGYESHFGFIKTKCVLCPFYNMSEQNYDELDLEIIKKMKGVAE